MGKAREPMPLNGMARLRQMRRQADLGQSPDDDWLRSTYPQLFSILTDTRVSAKEVCEPAALRVVNSNGEWSITLSVNALSMYCTVFGGTLQAGLALLETELANNTVKWTINTKRSVRIRKLRIEETSS